MHTAQNYKLSKTKHVYQCGKQGRTAVQLIIQKWCAEFASYACIIVIFLAQNSDNPNIVICLFDICPGNCNLYFFCSSVFIYSSHMSSSFFLCFLLTRLIFSTVLFLLQVYKYSVFLNLLILTFLQSRYFSAT